MGKIIPIHENFQEEKLLKNQGENDQNLVYIFYYQSGFGKILKPRVSNYNLNLKFFFQPLIIRFKN
jgi:hypothetical protein